MAIAVFNVLCDGFGGVNWAGLDLWVEKLGIEDVDGLLDRLRIIKLHKPTRDANSDANHRET